MEGPYSEGIQSVHGKAGSNQKSWVIPALPHQEAVIPSVCASTPGLLLGGMELLWGNTGQAHREGAELCPQVDFAEATTYK